MTLQELKDKVINEALKRNNGVIVKAAKDLNISARTIHNYIKQNGRKDRNKNSL